MNSGSITATEKRVAKSLASLLPKPNKKKKVSKPLEGLSGCQNLWKEPKSFYTKKKVSKPLEGLSGCQNLWKEPPAHVAWAYNPSLWVKEPPAHVAWAYNPSLWVKEHKVGE